MSEAGGEYLKKLEAERAAQVGRYGAGLGDSGRARAMRSDMQPEKQEPSVVGLPAKWRGEPNRSNEPYWVGWAQGRDAAANELDRTIARERHITLSADAVQTLAGSRDLERRCAQLQREVEVYRRALAQIISVHALEQP